MPEDTKLVRVSARTHATLKWLMHQFECNSRKDVAELLTSFATTGPGLEALKAYKGIQDSPGVYVDPRNVGPGSETVLEAVTHYMGDEDQAHRVIQQDPVLRAAHMAELEALVDGVLD